MDLNARVYVNCGLKEGQTDERTDGQTEKRTPISHLAEADATKIHKIDPSPLKLQMDFAMQLLRHELSKRFNAKL